MIDFFVMCSCRARIAMSECHDRFALASTYTAQKSTSVPDPPQHQAKQYPIYVAGDLNGHVRQNYPKKGASNKRGEQIEKWCKGAIKWSPEIDFYATRVML